MRYLSPYIHSDLKEKMVFLGGPRQCGKTSLGQNLLEQPGTTGHYYNWDDDTDKKLLLKHAWQKSESLLVLDEIHKYARWKSWVKGLYDKYKKEHQFLVTGSARLDVYRRDGDSLLGRYHYWRLHPFSLCELPAGVLPEEGYKRLLTVGGFPEPFIRNDTTFHRRWRKDRFDRVIKEDLRDLESVKQISNIELLVELLRSRVGSLIVVAHLAQDLQVAPQSVVRWIEMLERMYLIFTIKPYTAKLARSLSKPFKVYFYDNSDVDGDLGAKFENLVACHLLKRTQFLEDRDGYRYGLKFIRDKEKHEVDFVITKDKSLLALVEAKLADPNVSLSLRYFAERLKPQKAIQLVGNLNNPYSQGQIHVLDAVTTLSAFDYMSNTLEAI